jgi:hypothetical protein
MRGPEPPPDVTFTLSVTPSVTQAAVGDTVEYVYCGQNTSTIPLAELRLVDDRIGIVLEGEEPIAPGQSLCNTDVGAEVSYVVQPSDAGSIIRNNAVVTVRTQEAEPREFQQTAASEVAVPLLRGGERIIRVCHRTSDDDNPYNPQLHTESSVVSQGHASHTGPVWFPGITVGWGDIIESFEQTDGTQNPGYNWPEGQAILESGCDIPLPTPPETTIEPGTPEAATTEPETTDLPPTEAATTEPETTEAGTTEPATTEAATTVPETTEPGTTEPATTEAATTEPGTAEAATTEPATTEPATTEPATTEAATTEPATTETATTKPLAVETTEPLQTTEPIESSTSTSTTSTSTSSTTTSTSTTSTSTTSTSVPSAETTSTVAGSTTTSTLIPPPPGVTFTFTNDPSVAVAQVGETVEYSYCGQNTSDVDLEVVRVEDDRFGVLEVPDESTILSPGETLCNTDLGLPVSYVVAASDAGKTIVNNAVVTVRTVGAEPQAFQAADPAAVEILAAGERVEPTTTALPPTGLADTGASSIPLRLVVAVGMVASGSLVVFAARRRRAGSHGPPA